MAGIADWWKPIGVGDDGVAHSTTNAYGYRDAQDDAINEQNTANAAKANDQMNGLSTETYVAAGLQGVAKGIQAASATAAQRRAYENQATMYDAKAKTASLNANVARQNMYNAYQVGAFRAAQQGLVDAQRISNVRAAAAQSGVRMNSGSKADVEQSARYVKEVNRITNQQNTTSAAMKEYVNAANYKAAGIIAEGNAQAARTMEHGFSPLVSGLTTMSSTFASSLMAASGGNGATIGSWFSGLFGGK